MPPKRTREDIELTTALREAGRRFQQGKPIDIPALCRLIEGRRVQRPGMCAKLTDLIRALQDDAARGDRAGVSKHFLAAIDIACDQFGDE